MLMSAQACQNGSNSALSYWRGEAILPDLYQPGQQGTVLAFGDPGSVGQPANLHRRQCCEVGRADRRSEHRNAKTALDAIVPVGGKIIPGQIDNLHAAFVKSSQRDDFTRFGL
jgi:hypothetical protein